MAYLKTVEESNKKKEQNKRNRRARYAIKKNWIHKNVYNTSRWRKLRMLYLSENPLCEECLRNSVKKLAEHIHHKTEISTGNNDSEMIQLAFDINNLESLCSECHKKEHTREINYFLFDDENKDSKLNNDE